MPCRPGISTMSLGRCYAGHSLSHKLSMAAKYGLTGIEIFYEDLADLANPPNPSNLLAAATYIRETCTSLGQTIICLQPFMHYEGLIDRKKHAERIKELRLWIALARELGTDLVAIPSTFLPKDQCSSDIDLIVSDLREAADIAAEQQPPIRISYESLAWGTHTSTWEQCWDIVQRVDRPNFGIVLDTFNILARIYADPASADGRMPNAEQEVQDSVKRIVQQLTPHKDKISFVQLVDGERLSAPIKPGHPFYNAAQPAKMSWSRNCRLFYGETERGAYMPVTDVARAILKDVGYEGWVSFELFNRDMERRDEAVVEELAGRAAVCWGKLKKDLDLEEQPQASTRRASSFSQAYGAEFARL